MHWFIYAYATIAFVFILVIAVFVINCCRFAGKADEGADREMARFLGDI